MIRIRSAQLETLDEAIKERSYRRIGKLMRERLTPFVAAVPEDRLLAGIRASARTAAAYGVRSEQGVARFATMSLLVGDGFHRLPNIHRELTGGSRDVERFLEQLLDECAQEALRQAGRPG